MTRVLLTILPISVLFLQSIQKAQSDDLIDSPIFDVRPESKSLQEIQSNVKSQKMNLGRENEKTLKSKQSNLDYIKHILSKFLSTLKRNKRKVKYFGSKRNMARGKRKEKSSKWHKWTDWSTCSVTCGKGRVIRWRHCQENCDGIETEMEEMACQLPECPRKLFGMIKLKK